MKGHTNTHTIWNSNKYVDIGLLPSGKTRPEVVASNFWAKTHLKSDRKRIHCLSVDSSTAPSVLCRIVVNENYWFWFAATARLTDARKFVYIYGIGAHVQSFVKISLLLFSYDMQYDYRSSINSVRFYNKWSIELPAIIIIITQNFSVDENKKL